MVSHGLLTSGSPRSAAGGVDCNGRVCEEDGVGALLREGLGTLRTDVEAGPDPSCTSHLGKCREEASEKGCSAWFCSVSSH